MIKKGIALVAGIVTTLIAALAIYAFLVPSEAKIKSCFNTKMYNVYLCPDSKSYVKLKKIAPIVIKTIVLTEDSSFYTHQGFDWSSIEKNARAGWKTGHFKRGGSTISQQLAKNMFLSNERTFIRKGVEALITSKMEKVLTKEEILEKYLNIIEFGPNIFGIKAAASHYFQKAPSGITVIEAAFLAMILPNPVKYSSSFQKKQLTPFAYKRMNKIINDLHAYHRINEDQYNEAIHQLNYFFEEIPAMEGDPFEAELKEFLEIEEELKNEPKELPPKELEELENTEGEVEEETI